MSLIIVYAYSVYSPEQDAFVPANVDVFATMDVIKADSHLRIIESESLEVDSLQLNERGRYHRPPSKP